MRLLGRLLFPIAVGVTAVSLYRILALDLPPRPIWPVLLLAGSALMAGTLFGGRLVLWTLKDRTR